MNTLTMIFVAAIWGSTFIFQKISVGKIDPYFYSSLRFLLGAGALLPVIIFLKRKELFPSSHELSLARFSTKPFAILFLNPKMIKSGMIAGIMISFGVNLQQVAITHTQVTEVAFITGLYIIMVPFFEVFLGKRLSVHVFLSAALSMLGFYLLSYNNEIGQFGIGGLLTLVSTVCWALHIIYIDRCSKRFDNLIFAFQQFLFSGIFSLLFVIIVQADINFAQITASWLEIFYGGVISVGIGFTLQVFAQKRVSPHVAAIILSLETVFTAIFEVIFLGTFLKTTETIGTVFMFIAIIYIQLIKTLQKE